MGQHAKWRTARWTAWRAKRRPSPEPVGRTTTTRWHGTTTWLLRLGRASLAGCPCLGHGDGYGHGQHGQHGHGDGHGHYATGWRWQCPPTSPHPSAQGWSGQQRCSTRNRNRPGRALSWTTCSSGLWSRCCCCRRRRCCCYCWQYCCWQRQHSWQHCSRRQHQNRLQPWWQCSSCSCSSWALCVVRGPYSAKKTIIINSRSSFSAKVSVKIQSQSFFRSAVGDNETREDLGAATAATTMPTRPSNSVKIEIKVGVPPLVRWCWWQRQRPFRGESTCCQAF
mmetsp:Transcript_3718/g.5105  ORF Transcript_3718/g.5105 Transcript_3718/m.5105 type:complete len:280 (-) Transcript_3718:336-1175(-)